VDAALLAAGTSILTAALGSRPTPTARPGGTLVPPAATRRSGSFPGSSWTPTGGAAGVTAA